MIFEHLACTGDRRKDTKVREKMREPPRPPVLILYHAGQGTACAASLCPYG
ncbi:hypothetical protein [Sporomusa sphaeroides]|uniref:hypothetical protein n=1 Tax=Sporomusa sphaeroides TaxID=47679 RepID=UPI002BBFF9CD|nr:hypothetical protein [Sporomusa sphaeroides]HML35128.1 hypothetical protein [Sporomusa sphaeroides]